MRKLSLILLGLLICMPMLAQKGTYLVNRKAALSSSAEVVTLRLAAAATVVAQPLFVSIYSSADVEITIERDGTYVSGTALTANKSSTANLTATAAATYGTTITSTTVLQQHQVTSGSTLVVSLDMIAVKAGESLTIRTESATATKLLVNLCWREY